MRVGVQAGNRRVGSRAGSHVMFGDQCCRVKNSLEPEPLRRCSGMYEDRYPFTWWLMTYARTITDGPTGRSRLSAAAEQIAEDRVGGVVQRFDPADFHPFRDDQLAELREEPLRVRRPDNQ